MTLALLATLGATVIAFVLYPVFAEARSSGLARLGDVEREILELEELKSRLYTALTDLDFEKESGKVSEADYETARSDYMAQVATVLEKLDALAPRRADKKKPRKPDDGGAAISDTMARVWGDWVDAALILQKAGYKDEAAVFFERCIQEFALPELKARCTVALAAQSPDRAFALVLGLVDNGKGAAQDAEVQNLGLRLLGEFHLHAAKLPITALVARIEAEHVIAAHVRLRLLNAQRQIVVVQQRLATGIVGQCHQRVLL